MFESIRNIAAPLRRISWGFMFVLFDVNIGTFDILPDLIGYLIIFSGLSQLGQNDIDFRRAKWLSFILFICSLAGIFAPAVNYVSFASMPLSVHIFGQLTSLLTFILLVLIFRGLESLKLWEFFQEEEQLKQVIRFRRNGLLGLQALTMILYPFGFNVDSSALTVLLVLTVIQFVFYILLLALLFRMAKLVESGRG
ncbi:hypothetical protein M3231_01600 [Neobacillus mesonae]|nr:hypothetical protein [Neobacillus mesonae]